MRTTYSASYLAANASSSPSRWAAKAPWLGAFSGRPARGIVNRYMAAMAAHEDELPDFPLMNTVTGPLRKASAAVGSPDLIALWSGQAVGLNREATAAALMERLVEETRAAMARLQV